LGVQPAYAHRVTRLKAFLPQAKVGHFSFGVGKTFGKATDDTHLFMELDFLWRTHRRHVVQKIGGGTR